MNYLKKSLRLLFLFALLISFISCHQDVANTDNTNSGNEYDQDNIRIEKVDIYLLDEKDEDYTKHTPRVTFLYDENLHNDFKKVSMLSLPFTNQEKAIRDFCDYYGNPIIKSEDANGVVITNAHGITYSFSIDDFSLNISLAGNFYAASRDENLRITEYRGYMFFYEFCYDENGYITDAQIFSGQDLSFVPVFVYTLTDGSIKVTALETTE